MPGQGSVLDLAVVPSKPDNVTELRTNVVRDNVNKLRSDVVRDNVNKLRSDVVLGNVTKLRSEDELRGARLEMGLG